MKTHGSFEALTTNEDGRWREVIEAMTNYDSYHLPQFHRLAEIGGEGEARLLVYRSNGHCVAFPVMLREIICECGMGAEGGYKDATSVYGYPGPVASTAELPESIKQEFAAAVQEFFVDSRVVCAFSRLNPLINNTHLLAGYGETMEIGPTLSMDLTLSPDEQYKSIRRSHKHDIEWLVAMGVTCVEAGPEGMQDFLHIYMETMDRNHSDKYFYFSPQYFEYLTSKMPGLAHTFICRDSKGPVSGMVALECNGVIQGHLGGAANRLVHKGSMKLCYDAVRRWGNEIGAHTFHVGGGVGGMRDALLQYKHGFAKQEHRFFVWRHVVSPDLYRQVCMDVCHAHGAEPDESYFPAYRNPKMAKSSESTDQSRE